MHARAHSHTACVVLVLHEATSTPHAACTCEACTLYTLKHSLFPFLAASCTRECLCKQAGYWLMTYVPTQSLVCACMHLLRAHASSFTCKHTAILFTCKRTTTLSHTTSPPLSHKCSGDYSQLSLTSPMGKSGSKHFEDTNMLRFNLGD